MYRLAATPSARARLGALAITALACLANPAHAGKTLDTIKSRGQLACGVSTGVIGFSAADSQGQWKGLDVDIGKAIAAAVLGGTMLLGGRGSIPAAMTGALALELLFTLLNLLGLPKPLRDAVQGLIIIAAVAYAAYSMRRTR